MGRRRIWNRKHRAARSWQGWRGLKEDGWFGPVCLESHLGEQRRCGCPDNMQRRAERSQWEESCQLNITWALDISSLRYKDSAGRSLNDAIAASVAFWNDNAGCRLVHVDWTENATARIRAVAASISRSAMADSYLPNSDCRERLGQRYNSRLDWRWASLTSTLMHEVGHALGLAHVPGREKDALKNVMYYANNHGWDFNICAWELREIQKRYGKPASKPPPPPPSDGPRFITIPQAIEPGEYELIKVLDHE